MEGFTGAFNPNPIFLLGDSTVDSGRSTVQCWGVLESQLAMHLRVRLCPNRIPELTGGYIRPRHLQHDHSHKEKKGKKRTQDLNVIIYRAYVVVRVMVYDCGHKSSRIS